MPAAFRSKSTWGNAWKGSGEGVEAKRESVGWLDDAVVRQRTNEMKWYENETKWNEMKRNEMKSFTVRISCTSTRAECDSSVDSTPTHTQTQTQIHRSKAKPSQATPSQVEPHRNHNGNRIGNLIPCIRIRIQIQVCPLQGLVTISNSYVAQGSPESSILPSWHDDLWWTHANTKWKSPARLDFLSSPLPARTSVGLAV